MVRIIITLKRGAKDEIKKICDNTPEIYCRYKCVLYNNKEISCLDDSPWLSKSSDKWANKLVDVDKVFDFKNTEHIKKLDKVVWTNKADRQAWRKIKKYISELEKDHEEY